MAMSVGDKIQGDVESNDNLRRCVTSCRIHPSIEGETGNLYYYMFSHWDRKYLYQAALHRMSSLAF
ncbi:hypothetical protein C1H46_034504 [Malus baccata]|uniref:Uncharacterized protein n=1 Tax=Malus baccata TaxID=106549 RepID=A0A540L0E9_MALBA|nr:hypothetical protein C1H46_034504 [Malus baccata]